MYLVIVLLFLLPLLAVCSYLLVRFLPSRIAICSILTFFTNRVKGKLLVNLLSDKSIQFMVFPIILFGLRWFSYLGAAELELEIIATLAYFYLLGITVLLKLLFTTSKRNETLTFKIFCQSFSKHIFSAVFLGMIVEFFDISYLAYAGELLLLDCGFCSECLTGLQNQLNHVRSQIAANSRRLSAALNLRRNGLTGRNFTAIRLASNLERIQTYVVRIDLQVAMESHLRGQLGQRGVVLPLWSITPIQARHLARGRGYICDPNNPQ